MINQSEVDKIANQLKISKEEALDIWLTDRGLSVNKEQEELEKRAKGVVKADAGTKKHEKVDKKPRKVKVSAEKRELFDSIFVNLDRCEGVEPESIHILTEYKLIQVKIGEKTFKIDIIEQRPSKN